MSETDELETMEFFIDWEGKKERVVIRRLGWREELDLRKKWARVYRKGKDIELEVDYAKRILYTAARCIKVAPFFKPVDTLRKRLEIISTDNFPSDVGQKLEKEITEFHKFDEKKSVSTSELGNMEPETP